MNRSEKSEKKWHDLKLREQIFYACIIIGLLGRYLIAAFGGTLIISLISGIGLISSAVVAVVVVLLIIVVVIFYIATFSTITVTKTIREPLVNSEDQNSHK